MFFLFCFIVTNKKYIKVALAALLLPVLFTLLLWVMLEAGHAALKWVWAPVYQNLIEDKSKFYVYVLGESTAEGVHYQHRISPVRLMAYRFNDSLQGKPIEIIELAESGQGMEYHYFKFYFETLFTPHSAGLVFIYSGINENINNTPDKSHFGLWKKLQHSIVLGKLLYLWNVFENSPQKYEYRYTQILQHARHLKHRVIVSQLVGNIAGYDPTVGPNDPLALNASYTASLNRIFLSINSLDYEGALEQCLLLQKQMALPNPYLDYLRGLCYYHLGNCDSARLLLYAIPEQHTINSSGYAHWKNKIIQHAAAQSGAIVIPAFTLFAQHSPCGIISNTLIDDAHHPNVTGYCIMASELARVTSRLFNQPLKRPLIPSEVEINLHLDSTSYATTYRQLTEWYIYQSFVTEIKHLRIHKVKHYAQKFSRLNHHEPSLLLWQLLVAVLEQNQTGGLATINQIIKSGCSEEIVERIHNGFYHSMPGHVIIQATQQWAAHCGTSNPKGAQLLNHIQQTLR